MSKGVRVRVSPGAPMDYYMNNEIIFPEQDFAYLETAADIVRNQSISLDEEKVFDLLKIKYRWPKGSVEVINQASRSSDKFYCEDKFIIFDEWKKLYDLGFTSILCNILDLTQELRDLREELFKIKGSETNANFYFSKGTTAHRVSFPPHTHDYHVVAKGIYGTTTWQINNEIIQVNPGEVIVLPIGTPHAVIDSPEARLSLTINMSG